jgi:hypothetical protein
LEVGGGDVVAERGGVEVAQLADGEGVGGEGEAEVGVGELGAQALAGGVHDRLVVVGERGEPVDGVPAGVGGEGRVDVCGDEAEVGGGELAAERVAVGVAPGLELLEVGELLHVDLGGEVAADRLLQRLIGVEAAAGERPGAGVGVAGALPEQRREAAVADLQDGGEGGVPGCFRLGGGNHVDSVV